MNEFVRVLMVGMALFSAAPMWAQQETIQTGVDLVVVPASVKDSDGRFVYDLEQKW